MYNQINLTIKLWRFINLTSSGLDARLSSSKMREKKMSSMMTQ